MRQLFATVAQNTTNSMAKKSRLCESAYCFLSQDHALNG
ncbi:histidine kinase [Vibrio paracholerae]|uniref:Histidine kinase n=2 Tax=Vibrio TaxID=662 RepID=A0AAX1QSG1_9VIBR|nr:histidine kinase [Vibrio cholerae]RBM48333.1 histidine kinase [Vibrio paracholerae]NAO57800.1 histidine kinase [Vibrio cholerae]RBM57866.1 histidine kinase [Vibrio paracholerae]RBM62949.1 histidine kinase [Vibrio paracholerae]